MAGARVGRLDEAAIGLLATREDLGIIGPDPAHFLLADLSVHPVEHLRKMVFAREAPLHPSCSA
jgi:hypothetical protein